MSYKNADEAIELVKKGRGSLVGSVLTNDDSFAADLVYGVASHHGRFVVHNRHCYKESTGHGSPMPALVHGGLDERVEAKKWVELEVYFITCKEQRYRGTQRR